MSDAPSLTTDQGAALLWLRKAGGRAGCDRGGHVAAGRDFCPLVFVQFEALERRGLVEICQPGDLVGYRLAVVITEAGACQPIEPAAERRLDQLLRRFDD